LEDFSKFPFFWKVCQYIMRNFLLKKLTFFPKHSFFENFFRALYFFSIFVSSFLKNFHLIKNRQDIFQNFHFLINLFVNFSHVWLFLNAGALLKKLNIKMSMIFFWAVLKTFSFLYYFSWLFLKLAVFPNICWLLFPSKFPILGKKSAHS